MVVDVGRAWGLEDEHILVSDRRVDLDARLEREEFRDVTRGERDTQTV